MRRSIGLAAIDGVCARKRTHVAATSRASATKGLGWLAVRLHINMGGERIVLLAESGRWPVAGRLSLSVSRRFLTTELYTCFSLFCQSHARTSHDTQSISRHTCHVVWHDILLAPQSNNLDEKPWN